MSRPHPPPAEALLTNPRFALRIGREDALRMAWRAPVAVVYASGGALASGWFGPGSPFYLANGPYDYAALRYFLLSGAGSVGAGGLGGRKNAKPSPTGDAEPEPELVPLEEEEVAAPPKPVSGPRPTLMETTADVGMALEGLELLSPPKIPTPPKLPERPEVPGLPELPDLPKVPERPELPARPELPSLPEVPAVPEIPKPPEMPARPEIPTVPDLPAAPGLPAVPDIPPEPGIVTAAQQALAKHPIEIRLEDGSGGPLAGARYTLTLPDRSRLQGKSDAEGFIRVPDNRVPGEVELVLEGLDG